MTACPLSFSNNLTLASAGSLQMGISKTPRTNDALLVAGTLALNGSLVVSNLAGTLTLGDSFKFFTATTVSGNFSSVALPPLATGLAWNKTVLATTGVITVVSNTPPLIGKINFNGSPFGLNGSNGVPGNTYYVIGSTNLGLPLTNWTRLVTNVFDAGGNFGWTNPASAGSGQFFYSLLVP